MKWDLFLCGQGQCWRRQSMLFRVGRGSCSGVGRASAGVGRTTKHLALGRLTRRSCRPHRIRLPEKQRLWPCSSLLCTPCHVPQAPVQLVRPISQRRKPKLRETSKRPQGLDSEPEPSHGRAHALSGMPRANCHRKRSLRDLHTNHSMRCSQQLVLGWF